mgnify:CR=1 FL=1
MKKSKKTIIYMLVALVVAVSAVLVDFGGCYAQSYSDVLDADWKLMQGGNTKEPGGNISDSFSTDFPVLEQSLDKAKYTESCAWLNCDLKIGNSYVLESDSEIVLVCQYSSDGTPAMYGKDGSMYFCALSLSRIYSMLVSYKYDSSVSEELQSTSFVESSNSNNYKVGFTDSKMSGYDMVFKSLFSTSTDTAEKQLEFAVYTGKMKVFSSVSDAEQYFKTGDTSTMAWQGSEPKQTYNKDAKLESFKMDLHRSNDINKYYVDFSYSLPDELLNKGYSLKFEQVYRNEVGTGEVGAAHTSKDYSDFQYVVLSDNPFSCRFYLKDFNSLKTSFSDMLDRFNIHVLDGKYDSSYSEWLGIIPGFSAGDVTMSILYLNVRLTNSTENGYIYKCAINLLNGDNYVEPYEPSEDGTYSKVGDRETNGSYYTKVSVDGAGNTTYNYYYYYPDGDRKEVSSEDAANNTLSNTIQSGAIQNNNSPVFNNNNTITIEGDTITNEANNYASSNSSSSDNESFLSKFLGFFELLKNNKFLTVFSLVFGWLPPEVSVVITSAIGIICVIGVFKFMRK